MILPFSQQLKGKPTHFVERIVKSVLDGYTEIETDCFELLKQAESNYDGKYSFNWDIEKTVEPKLHTFRIDNKNRWKSGNKIHPVINNRSKNQLQFAPVFKCIHTQILHIDTNLEKVIVIGSVINKSLGWSNIQRFAINDGFNNTDDFFSALRSMHSGVITGKLIHWTNLKY